MLYDYFEIIESNDETKINIISIGKIQSRGIYSVLAPIINYVTCLAKGDKSYSFLDVEWMGILWH